MNRVLFLTNVPSGYRVDFFNELGKYCDLTVLFEKSNSKERNKNWAKLNFDSFRGIILKGISTSVDMSFCYAVIKYLSMKKFDKIIVSNPLTPTGILAVSYMKLRRIPYYIETDGGFAKDGRGIKEIIKKFIYKNATGYFSTAEETDVYFKTYGAKENSLHRYSFSSVKENDVLKSPLDSEQKDKIKKSLNIEGEKIVISVGQFIHRKGYDVLLKACRSFREDIHTYIIGGKPTDEYLNMKNEYDLKNVHFIDYLSKDVLINYYKCADVFVLPTREDIWGLVVNEALALGLPVITTDRCIAGLELIENGKNGYIVKTEDYDAISELVNEICGDEQRIYEMSNEALKVIMNYTIEKMAKDHIRILSNNEGAK